MASGMKDYQLKAVNSGGKERSNCAIEIDGEKRYAQIRCKRGLRRELFQLVDFYYDASTVVEVEGENLKVGELELVASSLGDAQEIAETIRRPAVEVKKQSENALKEIEAAVEDFLLAREEGILILMRLRKDPRATLLEASSAWGGLKGDPVEQLYSISQQKVATSRGWMDGVVEASEWKVGKRMVERIYALCYGVAKLQDAWFSGSAEDAEASKAFLIEMGIKAGDFRQLTLEGSSKKIVRMAHETLVPLIEFPKQIPERSELLGPPKRA
ncbi:MAG: hypothetical protein OK455_06000 [Thaumarchaeota archaeon]|nr:hypothetical protein [Nitrososphaerota archaeon]